MRPAILTAFASVCLLAGACQSTPSGTATADDGADVDGPNECEVDQDCAPDEVCVQDYGKYCESSCEAREPDLEQCGCAEGQYCEPGDGCPKIGCAGGQLCSSGECHDVSLATDCAEPTGWSLSTTVVEAGAGVVAIALAELDVDAGAELVMLRSGAIELRDGPVWSLSELENATLMRAANVAGEASQLLVAGANEAWLYASVLDGGDDPQLVQRESFVLLDIVDVQLGDFGGGPELDVWLQGVLESALYLGDADSGFAEPLSVNQPWKPRATAIGDVDLDGRDDVITSAMIWLGADAPAWTAPSLTVDAPAWIDPSSMVRPLAIPDGLVLAWGLILGAGEDAEQRTTIASYLALDSGAVTPSADALLYPGSPEQLLGLAGDEGWLGFDRDALVVYREQCRAVTQGTASYVDGHLDASGEALYLLTADGAVEQWSRP